MSFIETSSGVKLSYTLSINNPASNLLCIICHGTLVDKDLLFLPHLSDSLTTNCLRFDHQGNGESQGEFTIGGFQREAGDIRDVVHWARREGYRPVALIGHSKGGNNVLIYDAIYSDVPLIVPISARLNMNLLPTLLIPV